MISWGMCSTQYLSALCLCLLGSLPHFPVSQVQYVLFALSLLCCCSWLILLISKCVLQLMWFYHFCHCWAPALEPEELLMLLACFFHERTHQDKANRKQTVFTKILCRPATKGLSTENSRSGIAFIWQDGQGEQVGKDLWSSQLLKILFLLSLRLQRKCELSLGMYM